MSNDRTFALKSYPLTWPDDWPRTVAGLRKHAHFKTSGNRISVNGGWNRVVEQLGLMRIRQDDVLISTNVATRIDGLPRSDQREPSDPGVAVYWRTGQNAAMQCMAIDVYSDVAGNLAAVAATIEAMRAIERHGGARVQERAFRGFAALPAQTGKRPWREVLGVAGDNITRQFIEEQFRSLARVRHPDAGGSDAAMSELNAARDEALVEIGN